MTARQWLSAVGIGTAVAALSLIELGQTYIPGVVALGGMLFSLSLGVAVGAARWAPEVGLAAAWATGLLQIVGGVPILLTQASLVFVLFAAARWGRPATVALAGLSALLVPAAALVWGRAVGVSPGLPLFVTVLGAATDGGRGGRLLLLAVVLFGFPFLAGLALRFLGRARDAQQARTTAESQARQAQEIARLQEAQNRLARDVHDVVGHSLTVILAQAEAAQYVDDPDQLKRTMQTIATSARTSLQDVRQVLTPGQEAKPRRGGLDTLIESVRASGHPVHTTELGVARPLPPELDAVAYRVLQELLTNAIKHGRRDRPVSVERRWPEQDDTSGVLTIVVRNYIDDSAQATSGGQGLVGIGRRLESVGGRFEVHRHEEPAGPVFTATALVPVRQLPVEERRDAG